MYCSTLYVYLLLTPPIDHTHYIQAIGCDDGLVSLYQLNFNTVHGLYKERWVCNIQSDYNVKQILTLHISKITLEKNNALFVGSLKRTKACPSGQQLFNLFFMYKFIQ